MTKNTLENYATDSAPDAGPQNALTVIGNRTPLELFGPDNSLDSILDNLEKDVRSIDTDVTTPAGRKAIASLAYKVAQSKTALDSMGKGLTDEARKQIGLIDADRKQMRDRLDILKEEVRKPLTEWENKEKTRVQGFEARLAEIRSLLDDAFGLTAPEYEGRILRAKELHHHDWDEFKERADHDFGKTSKALNERLEAIIKQEQEAKELEALRADKEERDKKDREARIAAQAKAEAPHESSSK